MRGTQRGEELLKFGDRRVYRKLYSNRRDIPDLRYDHRNEKSELGAQSAESNLVRLIRIRSVSILVFARLHRRVSHF